MKMPTGNSRNANPGTLASESAWINPGRNVPGRSEAVEGDQMQGLVSTSSEPRRIIIELGERRTVTETRSYAVPVDILSVVHRGQPMVRTWTYETCPVALANDPAVTVMGGQFAFYDAERAKAVYEPWTVAWTYEIESAILVRNLVAALIGGSPIVRTVTVTRETAPRYRGVRYSEHEMQTPDMEVICSEWQAAEKIRRTAKLVKRAANRSNRATWGTVTVRTSEIIPE